MKFRLAIYAVWAFVILIAFLLSLTVLFTVSPSTADSVANILGPTKLSQMVRILY